jgi:ABC-type Zn uptake system ZnuABC Zn-binding protein ZnuA
MTWARREALAFAALRVLAALLLALLTPLSPAAAQERVRVVTTTSDLRSLAEAVGGENVSAVSLVPAGFDPEEYQPKPQDVARLRDARIIVRIGLDFDLWLDRMLVQSARPLQRGGDGYVDASSYIAVLEVRGATVGPGDGHAHGAGNPHYWLDPNNAEMITASILEGLARIDPAHTATYEANRQTFLHKLKAKLPEWEAKLAPLRGEALVAYHHTWAYFERRFRLNFAGYIEQKPGVPPSPAHLAGLLKMMRERKVKLIVREPHEPERNARYLAERTGANIVVLAPSVGALPGATDYLSLFDANIDALVNGSRGK